MVAVAAATITALLPTMSTSSAVAAPSVAPAAVTVPAASSTPNLRWVKADSVRLTANESRSSRTVARPDDGARLRVLDRSSDRLKVRLLNGKVGWVNKSAVTATPLRNVTGTRFTSSKVSLTRELSSRSTVVKTVRLGTKVSRVARTSGEAPHRVKVRLPGGTTGWVSSRALTTRNVWAQLARCESGGNPRTNTGNGYYGLYQFTAGTWRSVGGHGLPHWNSAAEQTRRAQILQERSGWGQWPACTRKLGLR